MPGPLRTVIADDEPLARQALRRVLTGDAGIDIVAEAEDLPSLRTVLSTAKVDLLFLDITMPGGSGLDAVPLVPPGCAIVFTTAHAEFAVRAYEIDAVDYLVKPFGQDRVREALARVRRLRQGQAGQQPAPLHVLLVRTGARLDPVPVRDVWRLEGCDDFVRVVTAGRHWLHGITLSALAAQLDPALFLRVHRSHIVNLAHVARIVPAGERRLSAEFPDGSSVECSRAGSVLLRSRARGADH